MWKTKKPSTDIRDTAVSFYYKSKVYKDISKELKLHLCTVGSIAHNWKEWGLIVNWCISKDFQS